MASVTEARFELDGRTALYRDRRSDDGLVLDGDEKASTLILEVDDFEDAQAVIATLDRSRARKSATKKEPAKNGHGEEPAPGEDLCAETHGEWRCVKKRGHADAHVSGLAHGFEWTTPEPKPRAVPAPCEATGCLSEGKPREDSGGNFCDGCSTSLGSTMRKQLHKSWSKAQAEKAQKIREDIERRPDPPTKAA